jgi:hypothetical protein
VTSGDPALPVRGDQAGRGNLTQRGLDGGGSDGPALAGQRDDEFVGGPGLSARSALSTRAAVGRGSVAGSASLASALW